MPKGHSWPAGVKDLCPKEKKYTSLWDTPENGLHPLLTPGICDITFTWKGLYLWAQGSIFPPFHLDLPLLSLDSMYQKATLSKVMCPPLKLSYTELWGLTISIMEEVSTRSWRHSQTCCYYKSFFPYYLRGLDLHFQKQLCALENSHSHFVPLWYLSS